MDTLLTISAAGTQPAPGVQAAPARPAAARLIFIDNIRWVMIMLVLSMHAAVTYSGHGSWYVMEPAKLGIPAGPDLPHLPGFLQSFFMGFLFFLAGYFVPGAYDKKGAARFLRDRAYRLGLPSLLFMFVIQPLTCYYVAGVWDTDRPVSSPITDIIFCTGDSIRFRSALVLCGPAFFLCCLCRVALSRPGRPGLKD